MENNWIKVNKRGKGEDYPDGTLVEVMFKNEKIVPAKIQGNWFVFNPKEIDANDFISGISQYRIVFEKQ